MKRFFCLLTGFVLLYLICCSSAQADVIPQPLVTMLQQRANLLSHSSFEWTSKFSQSPLPPSPEKKARIQHIIEEKVRREAHLNGITSETQIQSIVQQKINAFTATIQVPTFTNSHDWSIVRDGKNVLRIGETTPADGPTFASIRQFVSDGVGLMSARPLGSDNKKVDTILAYPTVVWSCPGNCVSYRPAGLDTQIGLDFNPEDFAMLSGTDPLVLYGCHWTLVSATPTTWVLKSTSVDDSREPMSIEMTLSKTYGGSPTQILIKELGVLSITYSADSFERYKDTWICNKSSYQEVWPYSYIRSQQWSLKNIKDSHSISLSSVDVLKHAFVRDGRLANIRISASEAATNPAVAQQTWVNYAWNGTLPKVEELKRLHLEQQPGEGSPDTNPSAANMQFFAGVLAIAGAIWMFRRRGSMV